MRFIQPIRILWFPRLRDCMRYRRAPQLAALLVLAACALAPAVAHSQSAPSRARSGAQDDSARVVELEALEVMAARGRLPVSGAFRQAMNRNLALSTPPRATGRRRSILVEGAMPTPSACWRLSGAGDRADTLIVLNLEARPAWARCPDVVEAFTYKVTIRRLPAGTYRLRIIHSYRDGAVPSSLAVDTTVAVR